jgi:hypothetical protein
MEDVNIFDVEWRRVDVESEVVRWRARRLLKIGYEPHEAAGLALSRIDIHELEQLIGNGCPLETAVRIVA